MFLLYYWCSFKVSINFPPFSAFTSTLFYLLTDKIYPYRFSISNSHVNGDLHPFLCRYITFALFFTKYSEDNAPLFPVEKFSTLLTVFFSNGTEVPPEVIHIIN